jgi:hypothetical protein
MGEFQEEKIWVQIIILILNIITISLTTITIFNNKIKLL